MPFRRYEACPFAGPDPALAWIAVSDMKSARLDELSARILDLIWNDGKLVEFNGRLALAACQRVLLSPTADRKSAIRYCRKQAEVDGAMKDSFVKMAELLEKG